MVVELVLFFFSFILRFAFEGGCYWSRVGFLYWRFYVVFGGILGVSVGFFLFVFCVSLCGDCVLLRAVGRLRSLCFLLMVGGGGGWIGFLVVLCLSTGGFVLTWFGVT